ncbi:nacht nucleoside triphosphatase [Daldinia vernicosa]|uniref:nacht nucleoside triphosphatase n=1 Tax=Daldinia vernicosa TaxID=114800 RepID=UPI002008DE75|nr:nacht nucleoside triphosphatase [Daldinia vernicosa]KAI0844760.1 nacht nucleoside triphosphatase [Daldinia vernicosa]
MIAAGYLILVILLAAGTIIFYIRPHGRITYPELRPPSSNECLSVPKQRGVRIHQVNTFPSSTETEADVDIIAVHGLDTKSPDTWTWKSGESGEMNWLSHPDMLPSQVGKARIFTCDWPADLFEPSDSVPKRIEELARLLLTAIHDVRAEDQERPLVFIASCLGGIILMKTLVMANLNPEYFHIRRSTRGIVFLATPFRGTAFHGVATWAELVLKARASIQGQQVSSLLEYTKASTFDTGELLRNFTGLCKDSEHPCQVVSFYETQPTNKCWIRQGKLLVDQYSATPDIVLDPLPFDRPHITMNKFFGPNDKEYNIVIGKVKNILRHIREGTLLERADAWIRTKRYTAERLKIERLSGDLLPMGQCYINLALIKQSENHSRDQIEESQLPQPSPFTLTARLKVEMPDEQSRVELEKIFEPRKAPRDEGDPLRPRRILIRGRAGVGKTTLCKKIIHEFVFGTMWNTLFDRVLWIPLRRLKTWEFNWCDFEELFYREYFSNCPDGHVYAKTLWHALRASPKKTLFILDGLDEVLHELKRDEPKYELLQNLLNQSNIIITSRPYVTSLSQLQGVDLELETIGFDPVQVKEYLQSTFKDSTNQENLVVESFLEKHRLIKDLVRIPIQLDALCYTWRGSLNLAPQTMTAIYQDIELGLWRKDIPRLGKTHEGNSVTEDQIQHESRLNIEKLADNEIHFLEGLAFKAMLDHKIDFDSKYLDEIPKKNTILNYTIRRLSFLRTSDSSLNPRDQNYHFIHLTYQEYFAARYFVRQWKTRKHLVQQQATTNQDIDPINFIRRYKYADYLDIMWRFVAGLLDTEEDEEAVRFLQAVEEEPGDLLGPTHQRLIMHCLSEVSTRTPFRAKLEMTLSGWLLLERNITRIPNLVKDIDFPDSALVTALQHSIEYDQQRILMFVRYRSHVSYSTIAAVIPLLEADLSGSMERIVCTIIRKFHIGLPSDAVKSVVEWLGRKERALRELAVETLGVQGYLSDEVVRYIVDRLKDHDLGVRSVCVKALRERPSLSYEVLRALVAQLGDKDSYWRAAMEVLEGISDIPNDILKDIVPLLGSENKEKRDRVVVMLRKQSTLPGEATQAIKELLGDDTKFVEFLKVKDESNPSNDSIGTNIGSNESNQISGRRVTDKTWRYYGQRRLEKPKKTYTSIRHTNDGTDAEGILPGSPQISHFTLLNDQLTESLYTVLLKRSFEESWAWYIDNGTSYIRHPSGVSKVPISNAIQFHKRIEEVRQKVWDEHGVKCVWEDEYGESKFVRKSPSKVMSILRACQLLVQLSGSPTHLAA